ncbi:MAG: hypothetical protein AB1641_14885 [Thermodesulfobacteriota bacterium]
MDKANYIGFGFFFGGLILAYLGWVMIGRPKLKPKPEEEGVRFMGPMLGLRTLIYMAGLFILLFGLSSVGVALMVLFV